jgi:hypothetical protein
MGVFICAMGQSGKQSSGAKAGNEAKQGTKLCRSSPAQII